MISPEYKKLVADKGKNQWLTRKSDVEELVGFIKSVSKKFKKIKILDAGCAQGRDSNELVTYGAVVTGIDNNKDFVNEATTKYPQIKFDYGDIKNLPYKDESFDVVYCVNTLFYTNPKEALLELIRVTRKSGFVFFTLDEQIIDLDKDKIIHSLNIDDVVDYIKGTKIIYKDYRERIDEIPFKHKHQFYLMVFQK